MRQVLLDPARDQNLFRLSRSSDLLGSFFCERRLL
jgi:hypothetical protein